jgi:hypothetical protein
LISGEHRQGVPKSWAHIHERVRMRAEGKRAH